MMQSISPPKSLPLQLVVAALFLLSACPESPVSPGTDGGDAQDVTFDMGPVCIPKCQGQRCGGPDGCGGNCPNGYCELGQRCDQGRCVCDISSCPEGCCADNTCFPGSADTHCGTGGAACVACQSPSQSCGSSQSCIQCTPQCAGKACGAPNECGGICSTGSCPSAQQICVGGQCVCNVTSCPTGCCKDNVCYAGDLPRYCGRGGELCADCEASGLDCLGSSRACGCEPQCAGKACGAPDGCGNVCQTGSCAAGQACVNGACVCNADSCPAGCCDASGSCQTGTADSACGPANPGNLGGACVNCSASNQQCVDRVCKDCGLWRVGPIAANLLDAAVDGDGRVYAVGSTSTHLQLVKIDSCGALELQRTTIGSWTRLGGRSIVIVGSDLWVAGYLVNATDPGQGYYGRYSKSTLAQAAGWSLSGGTGQDEIWAMVYTGSDFFMSGTAGYDDPTTVRAWSVKASTSGSACGTRTLDLNGGYGRGAHIDASRSYVYYTGIQEGQAFVARYPASSCVYPPPSCEPCAAPWTMTFQIDGLNTQGRALVTVGSNLYVAGFYTQADGDVQGFVVRIDVATKAITKTLKWAPSSKIDSFQAITADATRLYLAGGDQLESDLTGGRSIVMATDFELVRQWTRAPGEPRVYWDVETVGTDGLLLTGGSQSAGYVRRCRRDGTCN